MIQACAGPRFKDNLKDENTWITNGIRDAYIHLHECGYAHSFETWHQQKLVGGLYGVAIGQVFFGESMFHHIANSSKIAFVYMARLLKKWQYKLIDCQVCNDHLRRLGAEELERPLFEKLIKESVNKRPLSYKWQATDITDSIG